jgi:hypothetical protein
VTGLRVRSLDEPGAAQVFDSRAASLDRYELVVLAVDPHQRQPAHARSFSDRVQSALKGEKRGPLERAVPHEGIGRDCAIGSAYAGPGRPRVTVIA